MGNESQPKQVNMSSEKSELKDIFNSLEKLDKKKQFPEVNKKLFPYIPKPTI